MSRVIHFLYIILTIALGLLSRKVSFIPFFVGDLLYAVMMYWIVRFLTPSLPKNKNAVIALFICFAIELMQLWDLPILIYAREHPLLRLIVGQGFLWSDLAAYFAGILIALLLDRNIHK